jgi:hypothetical protein
VSEDIASEDTDFEDKGIEGKDFVDTDFEDTELVQQEAGQLLVVEKHLVCSVVVAYFELLHYSTAHGSTYKIWHPYLPIDAR